MSRAQHVLAACALLTSGAGAQVVSRPLTVVAEPPQTTFRALTVVTLGQPVALRMPTVSFICFADFNEDGGIDGSDLQAFFFAWEEGDPSADVNADGGIDGADVEAFFAVWEAGGCA
jgi:hypothetical protein